MKFSCPKTMQSHARLVLDGCYDIPGLHFEHPPVIVDVGANVGAFAVWASRRWPGAILHCYEPHPDNFRQLRANMEACGLVTGSLHKVAVTSFGSVNGVPLYEGRNNCGEASLTPGDEQDPATFYRVATFRPSDLPHGDILKLDCEGSEWDIIDACFPPRSAYVSPKAIMLEWHGYKNRYACGNKLAAGWRIVSDEQTSEERGIQKWLRP